MKVLVTTSTFGKNDRQPLTTLEEAELEVVLNPYGRKLTEAEAIELYPGHEYVIAGTEEITGKVLDATVDLRFIARMGAGIDNMDLAALSAKKIPWKHVSDSHVSAVAELALAGILNALRQIPLADASIRNGEWQKPMGRLLQEKNIGLIGLGKVARHLATLLKPFQASICAVDLQPDLEWATANSINVTTMENLLMTSDIVSIHVPGCSDTEHLIGAAELDAMKRDAILVNTSRGGIVDEVELCKHLETNPAFFAVLDVFEQEPYCGPLAQLPNTMLTTHIGSYASEVRVNMEQCSANQVVDFHRSQKQKNDQ